MVTGVVHVRPWSNDFESTVPGLKVFNQAAYTVPSFATASCGSNCQPTFLHARPQTNTNDLEAAVNACLATKDPASDACADAVTLSGLSSDVFWAKLAFSFKAQLAAKDEHGDTKTEPARSEKPDTAKTTTGELVGLVTACVHTHDRASEPCAKALALSGLSAEEFWTKLSTLFTSDTTTNEPKHEDKPSTKPTETSITALIKDCVAAYERARDTHEGGEAVSQVCKKAIDASGLSTSEFWSKFGPKPVTTEQPKPSTTPKPTTRPTTTPKPTTTQTVSDTQLVVMVKDCFAKYVAATAAKGDEDLGRAAYEACHMAIAASGLTNDAFWAKFGTPQAPKI